MLKVKVLRAIRFNGECKGKGVKGNAGCLTSQQHASASQGRICSDKFTCCHTEIEICGSNFLAHPVTVY